MKICFILIFFFGVQLQAQTASRNHVSPSASEILKSLAEQSKEVRQKFFAVMDGDSTAVPGTDIVSATFKIDLQMDLTADPRKVIVNVNPASGSGDSLDSSSANPLGQHLKNIGAVTYPAGASTMATVADWRASSEVTSIINEINAVISYCDGKIASTTKEWWFEIVPLHIYCHAINRQNLVSYKQLINMESASLSDNYVMNEIEFQWARTHAAAEVAAGAAIFQAHKKIHESAAYVKNKARCFPVGRPMVETVLASAGMTFTQPSSASPVALTKVDPNRMPEPLYALGVYEQYYDDAKNLIFNNYPSGLTPSTAPSFKLDNGSYQNFQFNSQGVLHFKFRMRDIHRPTSPSTCQWFCQNLESIKDIKNKSS